jgi:hypothetical protein
MLTTHITSALTKAFAELIDGTTDRSPVILNSGDTGLLRSLEILSAADASRSVNDGATIAAHAQHLAYGLSLMNRWASTGSDAFANPKWDEAWRVSGVDDRQWSAIRMDLTDQAHRWLQVLGSPREVTSLELAGLIGSIAHTAYHVGAIRQIAKSARGPREGTFA